MHFGAAIGRSVDVLRAVARIAYARHIVALLRSTTGKVHLATGGERPRCGVRSGNAVPFDGPVAEVTCQLGRQRAQAAADDGPDAPGRLRPPVRDLGSHSPEAGRTGVLVALAMAVAVAVVLAWFIRRRR